MSVREAVGQLIGRVLGGWSPPRSKSVVIMHIKRDLIKQIRFTYLGNSQNDGRIVPTSRVSILHHTKPRHWPKCHIIQQIVVQFVRDLGIREYSIRTRQVSSLQNEESQEDKSNKSKVEQAELRMRSQAKLSRINCYYTMIHEYITIS